jgi:hypothetical protein
MGIFDIFKKENKISKNNQSILHGIDCREWNDGYKNDEKSLIKFLKKQLNSKSPKEFINFIKKRDLYRKFIYNKANDTMHKISVTEPKGAVSLGLTKLGFCFFPSLALEKDMSIRGFRIVDTNITYGKEKGMKFEKGKTLIITSLDFKQEYLDFWKKKLSWENTVYYISFQFVDLDEDEYKFIKPFENKLKRNCTLDTWTEFAEVGYVGLFSTEKRKAYPINRFQTYLTFEE